MAEDEIVETEAVASAAEEFEDEDDIAAEIRDTDIVFDCPHCGHNLAIDYRGAGLQINCVNCGEAVLVPIPDGMNIDDLDIEPGEILKQLFATRRNLHKAELRADDLVSQLAEQTELREAAEAELAALREKLDELSHLCLTEHTLAGKIVDQVNGLLAGVAASGEEDESAE